MARESKKQWPLTISPELLAVWQKLRRKGDPELMATTLEVSRPVIDRALLHGHVTMQGLTDKITGFFETRLLREKEKAVQLTQLADSVHPINR